MNKSLLLIVTLVLFLLIIGCENNEITSSSAETNETVDEEVETTFDNDSTPNSSGSDSESPSQIDYDVLAQLIHDKVNAIRESYGLEKLAYDEELEYVARKHSEDMATDDYFEHFNPEGSSPTERAKLAGYECRTVTFSGDWAYIYDGIGENLALIPMYEYYTEYDNSINKYHWYTLDELAEITVEGWMNSPGHRKNLLDVYTVEAVSVAEKDYMLYITQDFCMKKAPSPELDYCSYEVYSTESYDCDDFNTFEEAEEIFQRCTYSDVYNLDFDSDGIPCENVGLVRAPEGEEKVTITEDLQKYLDNFERRWGEIDCSYDAYTCGMFTTYEEAEAVYLFCGPESKPPCGGLPSEKKEDGD